MSSPTDRFNMVTEELGKYPSAVLEEFQSAHSQLEAVLTSEDLEKWMARGLSVATLTVRSWEAASEFFRSSLVIHELVGNKGLIAWGDWGHELCQDSPTIAIAYFKVSSSVLSVIDAEQIPVWARMGRSLYKGSWKSTALSARFFEATPELLVGLQFDEMEKFTDLLDAIARRSYELASESIDLGIRTFPTMLVGKTAFIDLLGNLSYGNWKDVKATFEIGGQSLAKVERTNRELFMDLTKSVARSGAVSVPDFLRDASVALGEVPVDTHPAILSMSEALAQLSPPTVVDFIQSCPKVFEKITTDQLGYWFAEGMRLLRENGDGGTSYFRVESSRSEEFLDTLASGVELERIQELLRMYCRALCGANVDLAVTGDLVNKGIGWVENERPTTEGTTVFLPAVVDRYSEKDDNFLWFKVVATHQVAHLEFGSFDFDFDRSANVFENSRFNVKVADVTRAASGGETTDVDEAGVESAWVTDVSRFFDLFPDRKLILDIFTLLEDARLDFLVKFGYAGIRSAYQRVQSEALEQRPSIDDLMAREALMEVLVRLSLGDTGQLKVPADYINVTNRMRTVISRLLNPLSNVEDTAEASLRIYQIVAEIPNESVDEWDNMDPQDQDDSLEETEVEEPEVSSQMVEGLPSEDSEYQSPQDVDYRGEFKPELTQLLNQLRMNQEDASAQQMPAQPVSLDQLEQFLEKSAEVEIQAVEGKIDSSSGLYANNLLKEFGMSSIDPQDLSDSEYGRTDDDDRPLEATDPQTFLYDEWDFRANDYKPRWCMVREKVMAEGESPFYQKTLQDYSGLISQVRRQFELVLPESFRKIKHLPDGEEFDLDSVIDAIIDRKSGISPTDKVYWRRNKTVRDVAVVFLLDMSASTAEAIEDNKKKPDEWDAPDDPVEYMLWLRAKRNQGQRRPYKRIIDLEKESAVILIRALESIGDMYGIYGFSGYGRENVEFYVIKDINEALNDKVTQRIDKISPMHATRMGPAIRHVTAKLDRLDARTKLLFLISDGRPQDRGYSREGVEKEYAVHDTRMALIEARRKEITPFCLTVDKQGHDYLKTMCQDMGYEVLDDIAQLPERLPYLYRKLTM